MPTAPYYDSLGNKLPSVSEILDFDPSNANVIKWAKRKESYEEKNGKGSWDEMIKQSQDRGTDLHSMAIDTVILNCINPDKVYCPQFNEDGSENEKYLYWEGNKRNGLKYWLKDLLDEPFEIICAEKQFTHEVLKYGGTPDLVLKGLGGRMLGNITWLIDLKTFKGYETNYKVPKTKMDSILKYLGLSTLEKDKTYRYYSSTIYWSEENNSWMNKSCHHQYDRYRYKKRNETVPSFKGWDWYGEKLSRAFLQCILYRELLSHNGINTQNIRIVSASKLAGVQCFDLMDRNITRDSNKLLQVFNDARDEAFQKLKDYHAHKNIQLSEVA